MTIQQELQHYSDVINTRESNKESFETRLRRAITEVTGIDTDLFRCRVRKREIVQARQLFHTFMKDNTNLTLSDVGQLTGHDHASVVHSRKTINNLLENNKDIQFYYSEIEKRL